MNVKHLADKLKSSIRNNKSDLNKIKTNEMQDHVVKVIKANKTAAAEINSTATSATFLIYTVYHDTNVEVRGGYHFTFAF